MHRLAGGAADGPLRDPLRGHAAHRHHAVGDHHRGGAQGGGLRDGAVRQVAPRRLELDRWPHADRPGVRRVVRHPELRATRPRRPRRRATTPRRRRPPYIWEQKAAGRPRRSRSSISTTRRTRRPGSRAQGHRLHGAQRAGRQAVLPVLSDHADPLPDARPSGLRRQDRRRRYRRRDGRRGLQRRAHPRRLRELGIERDTLVLWCTDNGAEGRRPWRGSSGPWRGFYNTRHGGRHPHALRHSLAGAHPPRPDFERDRARDGPLPDARGRRGHRQAADRPRDRRHRHRCRSSKASGRISGARARSSSPAARSAP